MVKKYLPWQGILLLFLGLFFLRNWMLPMVSDDIPYAFIWDGADRGNLLDGVGMRQRITSFGDIIVSQWSHYMTWGGRILGIGLTQLFAWQGKELFNVLNTLVFGGLMLLVFRMGTGLSLRQMNRTYMLWLAFCFWFLLPDPFLTTLWMCGSCVFLWMGLLEFLFLLPFALKYWRPDFWNQPPIWAVPLMALSGLCAGWSVETGAAATGLIILLALWHFKRQHELQPWMVAGFICLCLGGIMLVEAPGEMVRLELQRQFEYNPGLPADMYWTPLMFRINFWECFWPVTKLWLPLVLLIGIYLRQLPQGQRWNKVTKFQAVMVAGALGVMLVMMFVPMAPARAGFFSTVAVIAASLSALKELLPSLKVFYSKYKGACHMVLASCLALGLLTAGLLCYVEWDVRQQWLSRIDYINAHKEQELVVVHQIDVLPLADELCEHWSCVIWNTDVLAWGSDLEPRPEGSHNLMYAQYYGWKKVITDGEDRRVE
ncbi:DUF3329 domain-containing protein [Selenomonas ruminantium]|uniref:4-amino-4-deoxy-L-arabinose transferase n=1 Tax=Selenomonas ruminantium TaxID=971 RepID=A0A1H3Y8E8_SELRU|nr:DUF6056 family protein [Selenomonas ruminantium]SEA07909.1 hypothetical protein SAMN05660648_01864 [Selenomonas ruminantium]